MNEKPMSFNEFIQGRVCKGDQARQDYEDYLREFDERDDEDARVC